MRVLVDSSVWINHIRAPEAALERLLAGGSVATHSFVIGELSLGHIKTREKVIASLAKLPRMPVVGHDELLLFVRANKLSGSGIGLVDAHLLASAKLDDAHFWTADRNAANIATRLGIRFVEER
jgi:predicted nucleic acid-binding protein